MQVNLPPRPDRRRCSAALLALSLPLSLSLPRQVRAADPPAGRILQVPFVAAETGFDPVQISDLYSNTVTPHIFEALYRYDHLARPIRIRLGCSTNSS